MTEPIRVELPGHYALRADEVASANPDGRESLLFFDAKNDSLVVPRMEPRRVYRVTVLLDPVGPDP